MDIKMMMRFLLRKNPDDANGKQNGAKYQKCDSVSKMPLRLLISDRLGRAKLTVNPTVRHSSNHRLG